MNKLKITLPAEMSEKQLKEDVAMTPFERLTLAFTISDFALELRPDNGQWKRNHRPLNGLS
jgi:hypothetical protein